MNTEEDKTEHPEYHPADMDDEYMEPEVERGLSAVASVPGKNIVIMVLMVIVVGVAVYYSFFAPEEDQKAKTKKAEPVPEVSSKGPTVRPESTDTDVAATTVMPSLPEPPPLIVPTPPPPPTPAPSPIPEPPAATTTASVIPKVSFSGDETARKAAEEAKRKEETARKAAQEARRKSSIMGIGGGVASVPGATTATTTAATQPAVESDFDPELTQAAQVKVTKIGKIEYIIAQGKVIDAVLETAINTDLPGALRAVVTRDVYAEAGQTILIPKGSRLIGTYEADIERGQRRVNVIWARIIRPDGIDIAVNSPAADQLGRAGVEGVVDNRYTELFSTAVLLSTISTGIAIVADKLTDSQQTSTSTTSSGTGTTTTTTGTATSAAVADSVEQIGDVGKEIAGQFMEINPTITVDQGTKIIVYVNRDLVFPARIANSMKTVE